MSPFVIWVGHGDVERLNGVFWVILAVSRFSKSHDSLQNVVFGVFKRGITSENAALRANGLIFRPSLLKRPTMLRVGGSGDVTEGAEGGEDGGDLVGALLGLAAIAGAEGLGIGAVGGEEAAQGGDLGGEIGGPL